MYRYKAFISHSHNDRKWAARLQRKLENFSFREGGIRRFPLRPVFLDRSELAVAPDLSSSLSASLAASDALIVVCSPDAAESHWVNDEVLAFKRMGRTKIFPVVVSNAPGATRQVTDFMPPALCHALDESGALTSVPVEPLAADARRDQDGGDALLKLIAGLLDVPFDSLKLRQHRRDKHKAFALAGVSVSIAVLTAYLATTAMLAREEAELHRDKAEELISYMLSDLRGELQPVGRLEVLDGVGEQVLTYFSGLSNSELNGEALLNRAKALRQIGEVRVSQGKFTEGLVAFNQSLQILSGQIPANEPQRLFELGQIHYWIADANLRNMQIEEAKEHIGSYLSISRQLVDLDPANEAYQLELLYAESNLGTLAFRENNLSLAREHFNNALDIGQSINRIGTTPDSVFELADTISWLGAIEAAEGRLGSALERYEEQIGLRQRLMALRGTPLDRHLLARALYLTADIKLQVADNQGAIEALEQSVRLYQELIAHDVQNEAWQTESVWAQAMLVRVSYTAGLQSADRARATLASAIDAVQNSGNEMNVERQRVLSRLQLELARIEFMEQKTDRALEISQQIVDEMAPLLTDFDRVRLLPLYSEASYIASESARSLGDETGARSLARQALEVIGLQESDPVETRVYATVLSYIAGNEEAATLMAEISGSEYRAEPYLTGTDSGTWWRSNVSFQNL